MPRTPLRHQALAVAMLAVLPGAAGCTAAQPTAASDSGAASGSGAAPGSGAASASGTVSASDAEPSAHAADLTCEAYCSETKLRTVNARLRWIGPGVAPEAYPQDAPAGITSEQVQTTIYKGGFDKDLYASFQVSGEAGSPRAASELPAYALEILDVTRSTASPDEPTAGDPPAARTTVEIEGLEPGMRYTWRVVIDTADGQEITETVTCEAPICTADDAGGLPH